MVNVPVLCLLAAGLQWDGWESLALTHPMLEIAVLRGSRMEARADPAFSKKLAEGEKCAAI